ncbi:MAG TPA: helix-turn-helix transcriptional regulator [Actinophytocola sp.]|nr:helix-turn-helix transcriptional regulator [Actinophytocola sp.]
MAGGGAARPTRRRQLGGELRQARELVGMSGRELASRIGVSQSKVSRIESGHATPTVLEVSRWADEVGATTERRGQLVALTESVFTEVHSWPATLSDRAHIQGEIEEREMRARLLRTFQPALVPGLLQTAEYARRVIAMGQVSRSAEEMADTLAGRLRRQLVVYDEGRRFEFVITEAALRWRPGPPRLLAAQLDRIATLTTLDNVSIGLIPLDAPAASPTSHGFVIYEANDDGQDAYVEVDTIHANLFAREPGDVTLYQRRWELLAGAALFGDAARALLAELGSEARAARG